MKTPDPGNPLIECPFCNKRIKGRSLAGHVKRVHAKEGGITPKQPNEPKSLEGVEIRYLKPLKKAKPYYIDEEGFLVPSNINVPDKHTRKAARKLDAPLPHPPVQQTNDFAAIRSLGKKVPGSASKKKRPKTQKIQRTLPVRPKPDEKINCPICQEVTTYKSLLNHISGKHPRQNAKMVMAIFNREYERAVKNNANTNQTTKRSK